MYIELGDEEYWGNDVPVASPIASFEHEKATSKHGLPIELKQWVCSIFAHGAGPNVARLWRRARKKSHSFGACAR